MHCDTFYEQTDSWPRFIVFYHLILRMRVSRCSNCSEWQEEAWTHSQSSLVVKVSIKTERARERHSHK